MNRFSIKAPAKVNLFLEVTGRRPDGYHLIETIFAKIRLFDSITVRKTAGSGISLRIKNSTGMKLDPGSGNLVMRAAVAFRKELGISGGLDIKLEKNIPIGAGLGGGSSDAASTLIALCGIYGVKRSSAKWRGVFRLAGKLGADVPFFMGEAAFCVGKGTGGKLFPFKAKGRLPWVVLVYPGIPVSTAQVYKRLELPGKKTVLTSRSALHKLKTGLAGGLPLSAWGKFLSNRLEDAVLPYCAPVRKTREEFLGMNSGAVLMSGSGSSVFALASSLNEAEILAKRAAKRGRSVFLTRFVSI